MRGRGYLDAEQAVQEGVQVEEDQVRWEGPAGSGRGLEDRDKLDDDITLVPPGQVVLLQPSTWF